MTLFALPHPRAVFRRCIALGGSLRLAVVLLFLIALACGAATFCEAKYGGSVARDWFYNAPWFSGVMAGVAVNLVCATLTRWPWRRRDLWFVSVHYGIVVLMCGAFVDRRFGFETLLRLHTPEVVNESQMVFAHRAPVVVQHGGVPSGVASSLATEKNEVRVRVRGGALVTGGVTLSPEPGRALVIPGTPLQVEVQQYWPDFAMEGGRPVSRSELPRNPAVQVRITGTAAFDAGEGEALMLRAVGARVGLLRFEIPRDETGEPSDFRSTVAFTDAATGKTEEAAVFLNHPVRYPGGVWRTALGLNAQFSQARWNPEDPGETTLLVSRDPGLPLKWLGSLLIAVGVGGLLFCWPVRRPL